MPRLPQSTGYSMPSPTSSSPRIRYDAEGRTDGNSMPSASTDCAIREPSDRRGSTAEPASGLLTRESPDSHRPAQRLRQPGASR
jgi:hypothetical protein